MRDPSGNPHLLPRMKIRAKLYLVVLPLVSVVVILAALFAYSASAEALEKATREALIKKAAWLQDYMDDQAVLLVDEGYLGDEYMREAALAGIEKHAGDLLQSDAEIIAAFDSTRRLVFFAGDGARKKDAALLADFNRKYLTVRTQSDAFSLQVYTAHERRDVLAVLDGVIGVSLLILLLALLTAAVFLHFLSAAVTGPIGAMQAVFDAYSFDRLSGKAREYPVLDVPSQDETSALAVSYNAMMARFAEAENELNRFARGREAAKNIEEKRRNIFQLYTPGEVVQKVLKTPADLLAGAKYEGTVLYSGLRQLSPLSENLPPATFVALLNRYFIKMTAIVRKKIGVNFNIEGDALLAGWGIPEPHAKDTVNAVHTALLMIEAVLTLNEENDKMGLPPLEVGIGLDSGFVTAGNISSGLKVNWTVMGGPVSVAVPLQKLTREYKDALLFTENVYKKVYAYFPCRFIDKVMLPTSPTGISLFTARLKITDRQKEAWKHHRIAVKLFYARKFTEALLRFEQALLTDPEDGISAIFIDRCRRYMKSPPPPMWDGTPPVFPGN
ncbi:MAG: adenylate/guanylate cyclase domain-containing protein [Spirochaetaceae bacterium]|jgi:class 3 adenylate cyclase|nr:adenylate/guanylate cyclase domain-containing protein [Spirochaetaceae bacterium]